MECNQHNCKIISFFIEPHPICPTIGLEYQKGFVKANSKNHPRQNNWFKINLYEEIIPIEII